MTAADGDHADTPTDTPVRMTQKAAPGRPVRDEGPVQARCEILQAGRVGAYHTLTLVAPEIAARARPGQFVSIAVEGHQTLLRRPFSIYGVSRLGGGGTVEVVYDVVGQGTAWLAGLGRHDAVDVVGPLGNGFPLPQHRVPCLLVGGGYGAAPLLYLTQRLRRDGCRVDLILGAATGDRLFNAIEARRLAASATFTTDDGSYGTPGRVTDVFDAVAARAGTRIVYACGPMPMLTAVSRAAAERRLPVQVAVEESMACGVGVCMTCVLPVHTPEGLRAVRACVDGPVFDGKRVAWEYDGLRLPDDAFAPGPAPGADGGAPAAGPATEGPGGPDGRDGPGRPGHAEGGDGDLWDTPVGGDRS